MPLLPLPDNAGEDSGGEGSYGRYKSLNACAGCNRPAQPTAEQIPQKEYDPTNVICAIIAASVFSLGAFMAVAAQFGHHEQAPAHPTAQVKPPLLKHKL